MSKYSDLSPCPFCGSDVEMCDFKGAATFFSCENEECGAVMYFDYGKIVRSADEAKRAYNRRSSCGAFTYILMGASVLLILLVLFCMLFVTERDKTDVSRETLFTSSTMQPAPDPEPAAVWYVDAAAADRPATEYANRLYTDADAEALARMAWGECRGVEALDGISADYQKAAAMWCALNRYDAGFEDSIAEIVAAPKQFHGYDPEHPLDDELLALAYDVLDRWQEEKAGAADVGRVLPAEYLFFVGDGENNYFSTEYGSGVYYTWSLPDVYAEEG